MRRTLALLAAALLLPTALATMPVALELASARPLHVDGALRMGGGSAALDLTRAVAEQAPWSLAAASAEGRRVSYPAQGIGSAWSATLPAAVDRIALPAGRLENVLCQETGCLVLLLAEGEGRLTLDGDVDAPLPWLERPRAYCGHAQCSDGPDDLTLILPPGTLLFPEARAAPSGDGQLVLVLRNASADWRTPDGTTHIDARSHHQTPVGSAGPYRGVHRYVRLDLANATVAGDAGPFDLLAPDAEGRLDGVLSSPAATGTLRVGGAQQAFADEHLLVEGALAFTAAPAGSDLVPMRVGKDADVQGTFEGDAHRVVLGARTWSPPPPAAVPAAVGTAAAFAALILLLAPRLILPLYSRVSADRVLAAPNRARLYELLRAQPGMTLTSLSRAAGLARVVTLHHLRMLEAHRIVTSRRAGRVRAYFLVGSMPPAGELGGQMALRDPTRRHVAALVARGSGVTQRDLTAATGLSQRLVSYHLKKLESVGLVRAESAPPRRYLPTPLLAPLLDAPAS